VFNFSRTSDVDFIENFFNFSVVNGNLAGLQESLDIFFEDEPLVFGVEVPEDVVHVELVKHALVVDESAHKLVVVDGA